MPFKKNQKTGIGSSRMKMRSPRQLPITLGGAPKTELRAQFAALCWRVHEGGTQVLMITSRGTRRWILPKGWAMDGLTPAEATAVEAWEEAGVEGDVVDQCLGIYSYDKDVEDRGSLPCIAMVYPIEVKSLAKKYPEASQRRRKWMSPKRAAERVAEPELAQILRDFDPAMLGKV